MKSFSHLVVREEVRLVEMCIVLVRKLKKVARDRNFAAIEGDEAESKNLFVVLEEEVSSDSGMFGVRFFFVMKISIREVFLGVLGLIHGRGLGDVSDSMVSEVPEL